MSGLSLSRGRNEKEAMNISSNKKMSASGGNRFMHFRLLMAVAILSVSIVAFEIQLVHFIRIVQWNHFAAMMISIALLGFGAGGTVLSLCRKWLLSRSEWMLPLLMIMTGLFMTLVVRVSRTEGFLFDSITLFVNSSQLTYLFLTCILYFLPFFTGGLAIGMVFVMNVRRIGTYYFSDLAGAGLGGLFAIFLFWYFTPQEIPSLIAFLPLLAGLFIIRKKFRTILLLLAAVTAGIAGFHLYSPFQAASSEYKGVSRALLLPSATITYERSSPYGLLQVVHSPVMRYAPGLSLTYTDPIPTSPMLYSNGDWYASLPHWSENDTSHLLNSSTLMLPYVFGARKKVLILEARTGLEISHALMNGAIEIDAVEPDKTIVSLMKNEFAGPTDSLFHHPGLRLHAEESRTYLGKTKGQFDLIQLPLLGSFGGTLGLNALGEEFLLTREAFSEMLDKLGPEGVMVISLWLDHPPRTCLRIAATIAECLELAGVENPLEHIALIRSWNTFTWAVKRMPMDSLEIGQIRSFCLDFEFDLTLLPGILPDERMQYHELEEEDFFENLDGIFSGQRTSLIETYDFKIQPVTDDKPYFFQFLRWKHFPELLDSMGQQSAPFVELGYLVAVATFMLVTVLALLFIVMPLLRFRWQGGNKTWVLLYFCGLGFGYMLLEIVFIKYFTLYLGHTVYSVSAVISIMLVSSGAGSYFSSGIPARRRPLVRLCGLIAICIVVYLLFIGRFLSSTVGFPFWMKMAFTFLLVALPSFFMGMPFPAGLRMAGRIRKSHVPWAWAINGCVSVISTSVAVIIAVESGFRVVMWISALAYALASLSVLILVRDRV